jgi:hypothetical protein
MSYCIKLSIDIEESLDNGSDQPIAGMTRYFDVENLDHLSAIVASFGDVSAALIKAEKLGMSDD